MALKGKNVDSSTSPVGEIEWEGPWGKINPCEVRFIHFVRTDHGVREIWTYPYETLVRWVFKKSESQQEIEILSGGDLITIRGYGLEKFLEPLETRCLERVQEQMIRFTGFEPGSCRVVEIKTEPSQVGRSS
jgi:hypothetical protein